MKNSINATRLVAVKTLKTFLSPIKFRGKGTILSMLCPQKGIVEISLFGYAFTCDLSEHIQRNIFLFDYDTDARRYISEKLKSGDTFLDIGANVGFYSLLASSIVGKAGRVISIEPNPKTYSKLKATIEKNRINNILLLNIGLGKEKRVVDLYFDPDAGNDSATMVGEIGKSCASVEVEVIPLDDVALANNISIIHYLKIDVDGFEPDVFAGASRILAEGTISFIQSEFCDFWLRENGSSPEILHKTITSSGFRDVEGAPKFAENCIVDRFFIKQ